MSKHTHTAPVTPPSSEALSLVPWLQADVEALATRIGERHTGLPGGSLRDES